MELVEEIYEKAKVNISVVVNDDIKNVIISNLEKNITDKNIRLISYNYNDINKINFFTDVSQSTNRVNRIPNDWIRKVKLTTSVIIFCIDWQHIFNKKDEEQRSLEKNVEEFCDSKREELQESERERKIKGEEEIRDEEMNKRKEEVKREEGNKNDNDISSGVSSDVGTGIGIGSENRNKNGNKNEYKNEYTNGYTNGEEKNVQNVEFMKEVNQQLSNKINELDQIIMKRKKVCKIILLVILPENTKNTEMYIKHITLLNSQNINAIFITLGLKEIHNKMKKLENLLKDCINHFFKQHLIFYERKSKTNMMSYFHYNFKKAYILEMLEKYDESMNIYVNLCKIFYENIGKENMPNRRIFFDYVVCFNSVSLRMISIYLYFKDIKKGMHHIYTHKKILFLALINKSFYHLNRLGQINKMEIASLFTRNDTGSQDFINYVLDLPFTSITNHKKSIEKEDKASNEIVLDLYEQISREYLYHNLLASVYFYVYRIFKNMNVSIEDVCLHGIYACINIYNQIKALNKMKKLMKEYHHIKFDNSVFIQDSTYLYNFLLNFLIQIWDSERKNRISNMVIINIYYLALIFYERKNFICSLFLVLQVFNYGDNCLFRNSIDEKLVKEGHCDINELFSSLCFFEEKKTYLYYRNADHYGCFIRLLVNNLGMLLNYRQMEGNQNDPNMSPLLITTTNLVTDGNHDISLYSKLFLQMCFEYLNNLINMEKQKQKQGKEEIEGNLNTEIETNKIETNEKGKGKDKGKEKGEAEEKAKADVESGMQKNKAYDNENKNKNKNEIEQFVKFMNKYFQFENKSLEFHTDLDIHIYDLYIKIYYYIKEKNNIHLFLNINKNPVHFCVLPFVGLSLNKKLQFYQLQYTDTLQNTRFYFTETINNINNESYSFILDYVEQNKELLDVNDYNKMKNEEEKYKSYFFLNEPNLINITIPYLEEKQNEWTVDCVELFFYFFNKIIKVTVDSFFSYRLKREYLELLDITKYKINYKMKYKMEETEKRNLLIESTDYSINRNSVLENPNVQRDNVNKTQEVHKNSLKNEEEIKRVNLDDIEENQTNDKLFHIRNIDKDEKEKEKEKGEQPKTQFFKLKKNVHLNKNKNIIIFNQKKFLYKKLATKHISYFIFPNKHVFYINEYNVVYFFVKYSKYIKNFEFMFSYDMNKEAEYVDFYVLTKKGNELNLCLVDKKQLLTFVGDEHMYIYKQKQDSHWENGTNRTNKHKRIDEKKTTEVTSEDTSEDTTEDTSEDTTEDTSEDTTKDTTEHTKEYESEIKKKSVNNEKTSFTSYESVESLDDFIIGKDFLNLDRVDVYLNETQNSGKLKKEETKREKLYGVEPIEKVKTVEKYEEKREGPHFFFFEIKGEKEESKRGKLKKIYGKSNFYNECYMFFKKVKNKKRKNSYFSFFKNKNEKLICIPFIVKPQNVKYININFEVAFQSVYIQDSLQYYMKYSVEPSLLTFVTKINRDTNTNSNTNSNTNTNTDTYNKEKTNHSMKHMEGMKRLGDLKQMGGTEDIHNDTTSAITTTTTNTTNTTTTTIYHNKSKNDDTESEVEQYYLYLYNNNTTEITIKNITHRKLKKVIHLNHKCTYCDLIETEKQHIIIKYQFHYKNFFFPFNKIFQKILFSHIVKLPFPKVTNTNRSRSRSRSRSTNVSKENSQQKEQKKSKIKIDVLYPKIVRFNEPFVIEAIITNETDITEEIYILLYDKNRKAKNKNQEKIRAGQEKSTKKLPILSNKKKVEKKKNSSSSESSGHGFYSDDLDNYLNPNYFHNDSNEGNFKKEYIVTGIKIMKNILLPYQTIKLKWTFIPLVYGFITIPNVLIKRKTKIKSNINVFSSNNIHTFVI